MYRFSEQRMRPTKMKTRSHAFVTLASILFLATSFAHAQQAPVELAREMLRDPNIRDLTFDRQITPAKLARLLTAKRVDLNGDGAPEFIVNGIGCGSANCPYRIYRKLGSRYVNVPAMLTESSSGRWLGEATVGETSSSPTIPVPTTSRRCSISSTARGMSSDRLKMKTRSVFDKDTWT